MVTGEPKPPEGFRRCFPKGCWQCPYDLAPAPVSQRSSRAPASRCWRGARAAALSRQMGISRTSTHLLSSTARFSKRQSSSQHVWFARHLHGSFRGLGLQLLCPHKASCSPPQPALALTPGSLSPCPACLLAAGDVGIRSHFAHASSASMVGHRYHRSFEGGTGTGSLLQPVEIQLTVVPSSARVGNTLLVQRNGKGTISATSQRWPQEPWSETSCSNSRKPHGNNLSRRQRRKAGSGCATLTFHSQHPFPRWGAQLRSVPGKANSAAPQLPHPAEKLAMTPQLPKPWNTALYSPNPGLTQGHP